MSYLSFLDYIYKYIHIWDIYIYKYIKLFWTDHEPQQANEKCHFFVDVGEMMFGCALQADCGIERAGRRGLLMGV